VRDTTDDREFDSRFDAAFQPGFDETFGFTDVSARAPEPRAESEIAVVAPIRRRALIDRFVVALWAIGAALVGAGFLGISGTIVGFGRSTYGPTPDYIVGLFFAQLAPWLVAIGLATLIGTLFLLAIRWEHRP